MEEFGQYSKLVLGAHSCAAEVIHLMEKVLEDTSFTPEDGAFVVCDYGTADGGASLDLMKYIIDWVQNKHGTEQQVHIIYEDRTANDFKSLLMMIYGEIPEAPSYLQDHKNVYVTFCATSFYSQCFPDNSIHLGFSSTAMHWLSQRPCNITGGEIYSMFIKDEKERQMFGDQAAKDWQTNLLNRTKELKPGGHMVIVASCIEPDGQFTGNTTRVRMNFYARVTYHWRTLAEEGRLTWEEFQAIHFNYYYRTKEEYTAPFEDSSSPIYKAGLKLISIESKCMPCPYNIHWLQEGKDGDIVAIRAHAQDYVKGMQPWTEGVFMYALRSRPKSEARAVVEEFYRRFMDDVTENPSEHAIDYVYSCIHIAKNK